MHKRWKNHFKIILFFHSLIMLSSLFNHLLIVWQMHVFYALTNMKKFFFFRFWISINASCVYASPSPTLWRLVRRERESRKSHGCWCIIQIIICYLYICTTDFIVQRVLYRSLCRPCNRSIKFGWKVSMFMPEFIGLFGRVSAIRPLDINFVKVDDVLETTLLACSYTLFFQCLHF